jgi:hypothetical protein
MKQRKIEILNVRTIDAQTCSITIQTQDAEDVVFLQACIESYEGLGTVKTEKAENSGLTIYTSKDLVDSCLELLKNL